MKYPETKTQKNTKDSTELSDSETDKFFGSDSDYDLLKKNSNSTKISEKKTPKKLKIIKKVVKKSSKKENNEIVDGKTEYGRAIDGNIEKIDEKINIDEYLNGDSNKILKLIDIDITKDQLKKIIDKYITIQCHCYNDIEKENEKKRAAFETIVIKHMDKFNNCNNDDATYLSKKLFEHNNSLHILMLQYIEKYVDNDNILSKEDYKYIILANYQKNFNPNNVNYKKLFNNFTFDDINDFLEFVSKNNIYYYIDYIFDYLNLNIYGKKTSKEEIKSYLYAMQIPSYKLSNTKLSGSKFYKYICEKKIQITKKHLNFISDVSNRTYFQKFEVSLESLHEEINLNDNDEQFLNCNTIEEVDDYIYKLNYNITTKTVIIACQNNMNIEIIKHLLTFKLKFGENSIGNIIKCYRNNKNFINLLMILSSEFNLCQSNIEEILLSQYLTSILDEKIIKKIKVTDKFVNNFIDSITINNFNHTITRNLIEHFEKILDEDDNESFKNLLAIYCGLYYKIGKKSIQRINEIKKKYNLKLNGLCLEYACKNILNIKKNILDIFNEDEIKPTFDSLKNFIKFSCINPEGIILLDLLD